MSWEVKKNELEREERKEEGVEVNNKKGNESTRWYI